MGTGLDFFCVPLLPHLLLDPHEKACSRFGESNKSAVATRKTAILRFSSFHSRKHAFILYRSSLITEGQIKRRTGNVVHGYVVAMRRTERDDVEWGRACGRVLGACTCICLPVCVALRRARSSDTIKSRGTTAISAIVRRGRRIKAHRQLGTWNFFTLQKC